MMNIKNIVLEMDKLAESLKSIENLPDKELEDISLKLRKIVYDACLVIDESLYSAFYEIYAFSINWIFNLFDFRKRKNIDECYEKITNYCNIRKTVYTF